MNRMPVVQFDDPANVRLLLYQCRHGTIGRHDRKIYRIASDGQGSRRRQGPQNIPIFSTERQEYLAHATFDTGR
jgi:hypothetical protein